MRSSPFFLVAVFALLLACAGTARAAATIEALEIRGLDRDDEDEALLIENIGVRLSLQDQIGRRVGESRLEYLIGQVPAETRQALEPFGYYDPQVTVEAPRAGGEDDRITVVVTVVKGEPVRVRDSSLEIQGEGGQDRYLKEDLAAFAPQPGAIFDHSLYEASKLRIVHRLLERGYFDADFTHRKVEVTRAEKAADITLAWASGIRYDMGPTIFHQDYFRPQLFEPLVYWEEGSYYHEGKLERLRQSLSGLDYFSAIDIQPDPDAAVEGRVPVHVNLTLAKRDIYTAGVSYGTESGAGVRFGLNRRYVNARGHKWSADLDYAQKRKSFVTQYRIPAFKWLDGWYGVALRAYDEQTDYIDTRRLELIGSRSGQISERWTAVASLHALRERWSYGQRTPGGDPIYQYSTLTYPQLTGSYVGVDDRLFPRRGFSGDIALRGGVEGAGSDATFAQLQSTIRWFRGIGQNSRLLVRGEFGTTYTDALVAMPPSLRFFAGGDRSVRGYAFREIGPRLENRFALGARNVLTGSVEYERYFDGSPWGAAVFVDTGSAFDDRPDFRTGVGIGVRWRSPVGPVRVDIARGLDDPDSSFQLYLNIGSGL
jgi:translocation and assembly module TamA